MYRSILLVLFFFVLIWLESACQSTPQDVDPLPQSTASYDQSLIETLKQEIADKRFKEVNSIVVLKKGEVLIEEYFNGASATKTHDVRSVGKTFASTVLGIALEEGHLKSVDQKLGAFYDLKQFKNYSPKKEQVTLKHFLTMTSGFDGFDFVPESIGNEENMYPQPNWVHWTLDLPMATDRNPGDQWFYFTAGVVVLGDIIHKHVPGGLENYAHEKLFEPLGIQNYRWQHTPQGVANTAGGIQLTPLGFAKFGQLYKNEGLWNGQQIIPKSWVQESFQQHAQTVEERLKYGYLWWYITYENQGKKYPAYACSGNGGNKIYVFEEVDLVVVITASAYGRPYMHRQADEMMEEFILPAVLD